MLPITITGRVKTGVPPLLLSGSHDGITIGFHMTREVFHTGPKLTVYISMSSVQTI